MLYRLYAWTLGLAAQPRAKWWLAFISCIESFIFPIPQDAMMIPMMLAQRKQAFIIATYALIGSLVGAGIGYTIGYLLMDSLGQWIVALYGLEDKSLSFIESYQSVGSFFVFLGALTPIPFKVITIFSGVAKISLFSFFVFAILGRSLRFYIFAALFYFCGDWIKGFIDRHFAWLSWLGLIVLVGGFIAMRWIFH